MPINLVSSDSFFSKKFADVLNEIIFFFEIVICGFVIKLSGKGSEILVVLFLVELLQQIIKI